MKTIYGRDDVTPMLAEIFRDLGYEATTLSRITERTGLGKGSLYHFFPGGKEEMASAVISEIDLWFETNVYRPLLEEPADAAIATMWRNVDTYFHSGARICLLGAFAQTDARDRFAEEINSYFRRWIDALATALVRRGVAGESAGSAAEDIVAGIQGALVLSRALDDPAVFSRTLASLQGRIAKCCQAAM